MAHVIYKSLFEDRKFTHDDTQLHEIMQRFFKNRFKSALTLASISANVESFEDQKFLWKNMCGDVIKSGELLNLPLIIRITCESVIMKNNACLDVNNCTS